MATYTLRINVPILTSSVANPSVITTDGSHGFETGDSVIIAGHVGSTPSINGTHVVTRINTTQFSIPVNVTVGGTVGKATGARKWLLGSLSIDEVLNGRHSMRADVYAADAHYRPREGAEIIFYEDSTIIFGGFVQRATERWSGDGEWIGIVTQVEAVAYTALADRFYVEETWPIGTTLEDMLTDLQTDYFAQYDLTLDPAQATGYTTTAEAKYLGTRGNELLNQLMQLSIADGTPFFWYIGHDKVWGAIEIGTLAAPFNLDDTGGTDPYIRGDMTVERSREQKPNRIHAVLGTDKLVDMVDSFVGDGATNTFVLTEKIRGYWWFDGLTGAAVAYGYLNYLAGTQSVGGSTSPMIWRYTDLTQSISRNIGGAPGLGDTFSIPYQAQFPITVTVEDSADIAANGLWEERVAFTDVYSRALGTQLAQARLDQNMSADTVIVKYRTWEPGIHPGMTQTIVNTKRNINADFLITDVSTRSEPKHPNLFWREVTAIQGNRTKSNWRDVYISWLGGGVSSTAIATPPIATPPGTLGSPAPPNRAVQYNEDFQFGGDDHFLFDYDVGGDDYGVEGLPARVAIGVDDESQQALALWNETAGKDKALTFWMLDTTGEVFLEGLSHFSLFADGELALVGSEGIDLDTAFDQWILFNQLAALQSVSMRIDRKTANFTAPEVSAFRAVGFTYIVDTASGNVTATLKPFADTEVATVANRRRVLIFKNIGANNLILDGDGTETITIGTSSATTLTLGPGHSCLLQAWDGTGPTWHVLAYSNGSATGGSPGGSDGQVQYNNGGSFGGNAEFVWDDTLKQLIVDRDVAATFDSAIVAARLDGHITLAPETDELLSITLGFVVDGSDWIPDNENPAYVWSVGTNGSASMGLEMTVGETPGVASSFSDLRGFFMSALGLFGIYEVGGLGTGAVPGCGVEISNNSSGSGAAGFIKFFERDGVTERYIWWDSGTMYSGTDAPTEDDSVPHTGTPFSSATPSTMTLLTADPGSPADDTWWVKRTGAGPYTISLNVRISGATSSFNIGST